MATEARPERSEPPPAGDGGPRPKARRDLTLGEEIANAVSHGTGLVAALVAAPLLVMATLRRGDPAAVVGAAVFSTTVVLLYLASTLYHAVPRSRAKRVLRMIDHGAIFLLIAGTYTPFTLGVLRGPWGWSLLGAVWALALAGIALKALRGARHPRLSLVLYLAAGWLALVAIGPLWTNVPMRGLLWLLAGGLAYTGGVVFYVSRGIRYSHLAWHLCVLAGTACHFVAVANYAA
jgi:hemolysin III